MINGRIEQFLDTGWYSEATLYLDGYIYWCEAQYDSQRSLNHFFVDKWAAKSENNTLFHSILEADGTLKWIRVFEDESNDLDMIKRHFLESPIFDNKTFWEVEKRIAWLDEGDPMIREGSNF